MEGSVLLLLLHWLLIKKTIIDMAFIRLLWSTQLKLAIKSLHFAYLQTAKCSDQSGVHKCSIYLS